MNNRVKVHDLSLRYYNCNIKFRRRYNEKNRKTNLPIKEKSTYSLQHPFKTPDWYTWVNESFIKASEEYKTIFLSIGDSTCNLRQFRKVISYKTCEMRTIMKFHMDDFEKDHEKQDSIAI